MSATSDSIQTLLKQRRELRQCLKELRDEISDLNSKAENMAEQNIGKKQQALLTDPSSVHSSSKPAVSVESKPLTVPASMPLKKDIADEKGNEKVEENQTEAGTSSSNPSTDNESDVEKDTVEEIEALPKSELLLRARLLSDYLQNHPSNVSADNLQVLEDQVAEIDEKNDESLSEAESKALRSAYRLVATQSFQQLGVNGETIADSNGSVPLLWGLPLTVAALTLVFFPIALLVQSLADRMFVNDFATEISNIISCVIAFAWGGAGALSSVCWSVAGKVHKKQYLEGNVRDSALRFTLGGVLGIIVFLMLSIWLSVSGILDEMIIGVAAFAAGLPSGILFDILERLFRRGKKANSKS